VYDAFRAVIPEVQNRAPVTLGVLAYLFVSFLPYLFMAYLAHLMRMLLLPTVVISAMRTAYRHVWTDPAINVYNWSQCLVAAVITVRSLAFAFTKEGILKVGEVQPGVMAVSVVTEDTADPSRVHDAQPGLWFLPQWLYDTLELALTLRGQGWAWGEGVHLPTYRRPLDRRGFLRATLISFLKNYLLLDFLNTLVKMFLGVGTSQGGSIFYPDLPPLQRYAVSTTIDLLSGSAVIAGLNMSYDFVSIIGVAFLQSSPSSWPPLMGNPWRADSLHAFWSKHWHQLARQTFLVFGGYPGEWLLGNTGLVLGAFIASGLFHECTMYTMNRGFDHRGITFFVIQGPFLIGERLWRKVTGRRVSGWGGRLWVYFCLFVLAQPLLDSWHMKGLGGAPIIPPHISPARLLLLPLAHRIRHYLLSRLHPVQA